MNRLQELKTQRERLVTWMDTCDAHFSVKANEELHEIEQEISEITKIK